MTTDSLSWLLLLVFSTTLFASALTFFTGFGLAMVLTPLFLAFLPPDQAVPLVAALHLINSLFKLFLTRTAVRWDVFRDFGIPAMVFAGIGAAVFNRIDGLSAPIHIYAWNDRIMAVTLVGFVLGSLLMIFAVVEVMPVLSRVRLGRNWIPLGGVLSGFFGGLSGHQGALRSTFLSRLDLSPAAFVATSAAIGAVVDLVRIGMYGKEMAAIGLKSVALPFSVGALATLAGAAFGQRLLKRVSLEWLRRFIALAVFLFGAALASGFVKS